MNGLTYTHIGGYDIPDLRLEAEPSKPIDKYGRMRRQYLREHRPILYNRLLLRGKLYQHLHEIDEAANARLDVLMPKLMASAGITDELKAADQMKWVGLMNTCKAQAEEVILTELIYE